MGTDIHAHIEIETDNGWEYGWYIDPVNRSSEIESDDGSPFYWRNYEFFAFLAGVRGFGGTAKGIPKDISNTTKDLIDEWGKDAHSHSWDNCRQLLLRIIKEKKRNPEFMEWLTHDLKKLELVLYNKHLGQNKNYRVVYWFDS